MCTCTNITGAEDAEQAVDAVEHLREQADTTTPAMPTADPMLTSTTTSDGSMLNDPASGAHFTRVLTQCVQLQVPTPTH
jgi:hypothetical protein